MAMSYHSFEILKTGDGEDNLQRIGLLRSANQHEIETPNLLALSSKGSVPHLTPDMLEAETAILAVHAGFEDFAEFTHNQPVHFSFPCPSSESPLRRFISLPRSPLLVLGPRRGKPVLSKGSNTYTSLNICTPFGHQGLEVTAYLEAIANSRPDVIIAPIDIEFGRQAPGSKRRDKMVERSTAWLRSFETALRQRKSKGESVPAAWVPILPIETEIQGTYLQHLEEAGPSFVDGILVYNSASTICTPKVLRDRPLISLTDPQTPHDVLKLVSLGVDLIAVPFITAATEAGIALDFEYPPKQSNSRKVLGVDMWSESHATDLSPLAVGCSCYACKHHHRAYIRHLLSVKEMLAWVLLQVHNHHVMSNFFTGIRNTIKDGSFEQATHDFSASYESGFPMFQGQGPRVRGYQTSLGANPKKLNQPPYSKMGRVSSSSNTSAGKTLNEKKEKILESQEAGGLTSGMDATMLEDLGFAGLYDEDANEELDQNAHVRKQ